MKRTNFIKSIFGALAVSTIPTSFLSAPPEKEYSFDELFDVPYNNENLIYPKDTELYRKIKELVGHERILENKYFTCYLGFHDNILPIKEKYTISDFMPFILATKSYYKKRNSFSETERGVFFRLFKETPETMHFDVFLGDVRGQYHS